VEPDETPIKFDEEEFDGALNRRSRLDSRIDDHRFANQQRIKSAFLKHKSLDPAGDEARGSGAKSQLQAIPIKKPSVKR